MKLILCTSLILTTALFGAGSKPHNGKPHSIPGKIEAEHFDDGEPGVAYHDVDEKNHGADYRDPTQVDIEKRPDASNGHGIGWTREGEWLNYTVEVKKTGAYSLEIPVASHKKGGVFHLEIEGKKVTGAIHIPDTGGWQILKLLKIEKVKLTKGRHVIRAVMVKKGASGSIGDIDYFKFEKTAK